MRDHIIQRLQQDHRNILRILSLMRMQIDFMSVHDGHALALISNAMHYMQQYPGLMHHPLEELIFDRVESEDDALVRVVTRLRSEHKEFPLMEADILVCISEQLGTDVDMRPRLRELGNAYLDAQGQHLQTEDVDFFPLAQDILSLAQWNQVYQMAASREDPIFGPQALARFDNLYDALMAAGLKLPH